MLLSQAEIGKDYVIKALNTDDEELNSFLFSLGCYSGETITLIARRGSSYVVVIKDARYNIDKELASAIVI
ncbi:MAG: ferrous iron transport protein A [Clostridia bacterium]|nr:ferrous iron transport protein A [Clostridia bacterium]